MVLTYPWFLLGLIALAVPVLIHFFELRRPQQLLFTNVEFIREVKLITAKQRRLQHLLVLALRLGFVASLVLLFCQPFVPAKDQQDVPFEAGANMVLDNSPSMLAESTSGLSLLEQGATELRQVVEVLPRTTQFRMWTNSVPQVGLSAEMMKAALVGSQVSSANAGISPRLPRLFSYAGSRAQPMFIVSDFQRSGFEPTQLKGGSRQSAVYLMPVLGKAASNVYADSVYLTEEFIKAGVDLPLQVRLRNGGNLAATDVQVRVLIGQKQAGSFTVNLPVGASVTQTVRLRLTEAGPQQCRVEIEEQPVTFDNTYYFTLAAAGRIRVVDVSASRPATQRLFPNEPTFDYTLAQSLVSAALKDTDLLLIQGGARIGAEERARTRQFVQQGGTLVIVPPASASLRSAYEQLLADLSLTAVRWKNAGAAAQELAWPDQQNPFFKEVFAEQNRQPDMPRATPLLSWSRSTTDVLKFRDGEPYFSGFRSGEGMVYVFASSLEPALSTFVDHPLFVPVMYRLATLSKTREQLPAYRLTDRSVVLRQGAAAQRGGAEQVYKLSNDSSSFIVAHQVRDGRLYLQLPPEMRQAGFYRLSSGEQTLALLAFNVDKKESELACYSPDELRQIAAAYPNVHVYEAGGERSVAARFAEDRAGTPLWRYCLLGALLCLLGEALVLRFGRHEQRVQRQAA